MYTVYMCGGGGANVTAIVVNITDTRDTVVGVRGCGGEGRGYSYSTGSRSDSIIQTEKKKTRGKNLLEISPPSGFHLILSGS